MRLFKEKIDSYLLIVLAVFASLQLSLVWSGGTYEVFNSPDANANYHFAKRIFSGAPFSSSLKEFPEEVREFMFTRSTKVVDNSLVPVGFPGLIGIYGYVSKALFFNLIPYLTIAASLMGIFFFYRLIELLFDKKIALLSAILLGIHPAWLYYTNDSMLPNVLFSSLAITSLYYLVVGIRRNNMSSYVAFGLSLALAISVRVSEVLWLIPVILMILASHKSRVNWRYFGYAFFAVAVFIGLVWFIQTGITGSVIGIGYSLGQDVTGIFGFVKAYLIPFGFHPRLIVTNTMNYGILFFWPFTLAMLVGGALIVWRGSPTHRLYCIAATGIALIVALYYGSWIVTDSPNPSHITIGTSYVRYFLPGFVSAIPFAAYAINWIRERMSGKFSLLVTTVIVAMLAVFTYSTTIVGSAESIFAKQDTLRTYEKVNEWVRENTSATSVMLTAKGDKYIWPARPVITALEDGRLYERLPYAFASGFDVYYVGVTSDTAAQSEIVERLGTVRIVMGEPVFTLSDISIYQLTSDE